MSSWVQLGGFVAILVYMAYGQWLSKDNAKTIKDDLNNSAKVIKDDLSVAAGKIDENSVKADNLHSLWDKRLEGLDSRLNTLDHLLTGLKAMIEANVERISKNEKTIEAVRKDVTEHDKQLALGHADLDKRITILEKAPVAAQSGPSIQPVTIVNPEPIPVVQTPEERLSEIRGEPK